jgi:glycosyltransferase involved in cell wall biosynthesis
VPHPVHLFEPGRPDRAGLGLPQGRILALAAMDLRSTLARKNLDGLLSIIQSAGSIAKLEFVLKISGTASEPQALAHVRRRLARQPGVHLILDDLPRGDMARLVASVDIILSPHRAEGFGLLLAEGMQAGRVVVATGWSGNVDFMGPEVSVLLDHVLVPVIDPQRRYANSCWAEPSVPLAVAALARLAGDSEARAAMGLAAPLYLATALGGERWIDRTAISLPAKASLAAGFR